MKNIFCKHEYEEFYVENKIEDKDGMTMVIKILKCKKCDKLKVEDNGTRYRMDIVRR